MTSALRNLLSKSWTVSKVFVVLPKPLANGSYIAAASSKVHQFSTGTHFMLQKDNEFRSSNFSTNHHEEQRFEEDDSTVLRWSGGGESNDRYGGSRGDRYGSRGDRYGRSDRFDREDRYGEDDRYGGGRGRNASPGRLRRTDEYGGGRGGLDYDEGGGRSFGGGNFGQGLTQKDFSKSEAFERNVYDPKREMGPEEAEQFRTENAITIVHCKEDCPAPIANFDDVNFPEEINEHFRSLGFESPMPIQAQGWPIALSGRDLIAIGQTGSGKTLGFLLPALMHVLSAKGAEQEGRDFHNFESKPRAVVMAPTRELAQQIESVLYKLAYGMPRHNRIFSTCVFGGASKDQQIRKLQRGVDVVIATPGRLIDLMEGGHISLDKTTYFVLDEADRMLDMGFEPQIRSILTQIRPDRQMQMWSATWPEEVRELAGQLLSSAEESKRDQFVHLNIGSTELQANKCIKQNVEVIEPFHKINRLLELMAQIKSEAEDAGGESSDFKVLIFAQTKRTVDHIDKVLYREGFRVMGIHGDRSQNQRDRCLQNFRNGRVDILVATDVASRGLDVDDIKHVVNFDFPNDVESYVHRIGRTGRRGRSGTAHSFITARPDDARLAKPLIKVLKQAEQEVPAALSNLVGMAPMGKGGNKRYGGMAMRNNNRYSRDFGGGGGYRSQGGSSSYRHRNRNLDDDDW